MLLKHLAERLRRRWRETAATGLALALAGGLVLYPTRNALRFTSDSHPRISALLRTLPKGTLIAGVPSETNSLASFSGRPVLFSYEHALAYHPGYYRQIAARIEAEVAAYYAERPAEVLDFMDRFGVDVFLVNRSAYDPRQAEWLWTPRAGAWPPYMALIRERAQARRDSALYDASLRCARLVEGDVAVVQRRCLARL
jgi:hypothetical protein